MKKLIYSSLLAVLLPCICLINANAQEKDSTVYNFISMESPPMYPGGMASFYRFLGENIKYPLDALKENIEGSVLLSFIIEKDGAISDIKVDRKLGGGTDEEAVRVLKIAKRWNPGMQNGRPVRAQYNIPIKFTKPDSKVMSASPKAIAAPNTVYVEDNTVYNFMSLETPPQYKGGLIKLYEFIGENIKYPEEAVKSKVQGTVLMSFFVEKNGTLSNIKVDRKLGAGTDEEALRVLNLSEKWMPGMVNGKAVRVKYNIPIKFALNK